MRLEIGRRNGEHAAVVVFDDDMRRRPSRLAADGAGAFERAQKGMAEKGIEALSLQNIVRRNAWVRIGAAIPLHCLDLIDRRDKTDSET